MRLLYKHNFALGKVEAILVTDFFMWMLGTLGQICMTDRYDTLLTIGKSDFAMRSFEPIPTY